VNVNDAPRRSAVALITRQDVVKVAIGMTVTIRPFTRMDQAAARRVVLEGLRDHFGGIDETLNPDLDDIEQSFLAGGHAFLVAEDAGEIIGTVGLVTEVQGARMVRLSVLKDHRRKGVASQLLQECIRITTERELREIVAWTEPQWTDAVAFYARSGFEEYGRDPIDVHLRLSLDRD
jgi:N-acetylglutamate synthase-like GNAT family acetyltransferase